MAATYLPAMWCPVCRRRESHPGFRTELENLAGDAKGKGTSGDNREAESTDASERGGLPRISDDAPGCVAFRLMHGVGTQNRTLSRLEGWPMRPPCQRFAETLAGNCA